jgi:amidohydrolase
MTRFLRVKESVKEILEEIIQVRRHIHQNPELSFEEEKTSAFICTKLDEWGIKYKKGYAKHGILGIIEGVNPDAKTIALRGDMDALPVMEKNGLDFASRNQGVMHACGHDIHTACLLGAAWVLKNHAAEFKGRVLLIFQPGEEKIPGGAKLMMEDGLFSEFVPEIIIGQHVYPELPAGKIGLRAGSYMASSDEIDITFYSKGGHAALPHTTTDTLLMAAQTLVSLQQISSRFIPANIPAVLSFGNIRCDSVMNVIPSEVKLEGTFRIMSEEWRYKVHERIKQIADGVCMSMGGKCEVEIRVGFPNVYNQPELTSRVKTVGKELLGNENVFDLDVRMTAEDFGWFSQKYPSCFYRLGVGYSDGNICGGLHTPHFNPNEEAIKVGVETMASFALSELEK